MFYSMASLAQSLFDNTTCSLSLACLFQNLLIEMTCSVSLVCPSQRGHKYPKIFCFLTVCPKITHPSLHVLFSASAAQISENLWFFAASKTSNNESIFWCFCLFCFCLSAASKKPSWHGYILLFCLCSSNIWSKIWNFPLCLCGSNIRTTRICLAFWNIKISNLQNHFVHELCSASSLLCSLCRLKSAERQEMFCSSVSVAQIRSRQNHAPLCCLSSSNIRSKRIWLTFWIFDISKNW